MRIPSSRLGIGAALLAGALVLTACSSGPTDSGKDSDSSASSSSSVEKGAYPVTIDHAFGSTEVTKAPKRVVTLGWSDQDAVLALGTSPVGAVKVNWGGNANSSTPWYDAEAKKVDAKQPTRLDDADGIPFDDVAKLKPDLILATNSGLTKADYTKLVKIAPVVAYPKVAWGTSWQDSTDMVGQALGRPKAAAALVDKTEGEMAAFGKANPQLKDTTFVFATFDPKDTSQIGYYTPLDNRTQMLVDLGMKNAPMVDQLSKGSAEFWKTVSAERASQLKSDVLISYGETAKDEATVKANKLFGQIPAVKSGHSDFLVDKTDSLTMSAPSVLAMPWFLDRIAPSIAKTAEGAAAS